MRAAFEYGEETTSRTLAEKSRDLCDDMGMDEVSSDEDGVDYRFENEDGTKGIVFIEFDADRVTVEWLDGSPVQEFEGDEGDTLDNVRNALV